MVDRARGRDLAVGLLVAAVTLGLSWALSGAAGSAGLPRTDDWAFARVAFELHRTGAVHLVGWGEMSLVGLAAWAQPWLWVFGDHQWALDLAAGALVGAGLVAAYVLARRALSTAGSVLVVTSVALFPGFVRDASAFMTDAPAFGVQVLCLLAGVVAIGASGPRRTVWSWVAVALGVFAFSIRELAVAAPLAVLAADMGSPGRRLRSIAARCAALAATCGGFWLWHRSLSGTQAWFGRPTWLTGAAYVVAAGVTAALGLAPALVWSAPRWWHTPRPWVRVGGVVCGLVVLGVLPWYAHHARIATVWFVGDYLGQLGMDGNKIVLGIRPALVPGALWAAFEVVAVTAFAAVCGLLAEAGVARLARRPVAGRAGAATDTPGTFAADAAGRGAADGGRERATALLALRWFVALTAAGLLVATVLNGVIFDRYLWPLVFAGGVLLVALRAAPGCVPSAGPVPAGPSRGRARIGAGAVLAGIGALAVALTANSDAFDAARWRAGEQLVAGGIPAGRVDAGFEWVGSHATGVADIHRAAISANRAWWVSMFGLPAMCAVVTASPVALPGYVATGRVAWRPVLAWGSASLTLYRLPGCG